MNAPQADMAWTTVLFDLDGTLLDTRPGIGAAVAAALAETSSGSRPVVDPNWSQPLAALLAQLMPDAGEPLRALALASFRRHYDGGLWAEAALFDGAREALASLCRAGLRLFVVTNKRRTSATLLLEKFGLATYLDGVEAQDDLGDAVSKAALAVRCLRAAGIATASAVVVGDSDLDEQMADTLGLTFIAVTSGTGPLSGGDGHHGRVEVASLAEAAQFVLNHPGRTS